MTNTILGSLTQTYIYVQDHRGDTIALVDGSNAGLYYYGFRWYDPIAKRWTQPDPSGLKAGLDLYRFCGNDPINGVDSDISVGE